MSVSTLTWLSGIVRAFLGFEIRVCEHGVLELLYTEIQAKKTATLNKLYLLEKISVSKEIFGKRFLYLFLHVNNVSQSGARF